MRLISICKFPKIQSIFQVLQFLHLQSTNQVLHLQIFQNLIYINIYLIIELKQTHYLVFKRQNNYKNLLNIFHQLLHKLQQYIF
ncbi:hypothetical protein IMG5_044970 [Ichthyophthirius multifiliis]|uniref:Uncharacterized protein n=1 Tax=Ichthyophthirius multifiliis TaxID=5932 RepID=G0QM61_ICHMU|nr:hypothetical protein IMG5_044970 [Ichthyophthirius multifiliis]EGR33694.1 hypothetical protein IMG5_044970 [Ichthyophthirius multifiliis]|eukprot:XP_004037680.1 hypothetical protein IMG5_044970 [Ichthyophthirius multifiliis]